MAYNYFYFYFTRSASHNVKLAAMERENLNKQTIIQVLDEIGIEVSGKVTSFFLKGWLAIAKLKPLSLFISLLLVL